MAERTPLRENNKVFIRADQRHWIGRVHSVDEREVVIESPTWMTYIPKLNDTLTSGIQNEDKYDVLPKETFVSIPWAKIQDACDWKHDLPSEKK